MQNRKKKTEGNKLILKYQYWSQKTTRKKKAGWGFQNLKQSMNAHSFHKNQPITFLLTEESTNHGSTTSFTFLLCGWNVSILHKRGQIAEMIFGQAAM